jgi:dihydroxy-acid dehydratase
LDIPPFATDGRFSGGSTGVLIAHLPDAYKDNSITALIRNGDIIKLDLASNNITLDVSNEELEKREKKLIKPKLKLDGYLEKFRKLSGDLKDGYLT